MPTAPRSTVFRLFPLLFALFAVAPAWAQVPAADEARRSAKALKEAGAAAMEAKQYGLALERFEQAYKVYPSPNLRYNMGLALSALDRIPEAIAAFEAFLDGAQDAPEEARVHARTQVGEMGGRVGRLLVIHSVEQAEIRIDGKKVGTTPLPRALRLMPGRHEVRADREGFLPLSKVVTLRAGETQRFEVFLVSLVAPPPTSAAPTFPASVPEPTPTRARLWTWVFAGTAVALLAGGAILSVHARSQLDEYRMTTSKERFEALRDSISTEGTAGTVLLVAGGAAAATAGVLFFLEERPEATSSGHTLRLQASGLGVAWRGRF